MLDTLLDIEQQYEQLQDQLMDPDVVSDLDLLRSLSKKSSDLEHMVSIIRRYKKILQDVSEAKEVLSTETDTDMISMAQEQLDYSSAQLPSIEEEIKIALLPKDPNDDKNIFLEIRPAAGGDEAGLFAAELLKAYLMYASIKWRKTEMIEQQYNDIGWVKFVMVKIAGDKVYSIMKYESGVHRVQRIPATESNGRIHTSTITVAIMPEVDDVEVDIQAKDIQMDTYAASSAGWQNANKNQTGVRLHHIPTGLIVTIGDSKSQMHNKEKAFAVLKSRLYQIEQDKHQAQQRDTRGTQIWDGDRSEKIKTYNFPQDRLTDHRIKQSRSNLPGIMTWNIEDSIQSAVMYFQSQALAQNTTA